MTDDISAYRLHLILQEVMGWWNYDLYQFTIDKLRYADPDPNYGMTDRNARRYSLWQVFGHTVVSPEVLAGFQRLDSKW